MEEYSSERYASQSLLWQRSFKSCRVSPMANLTNALALFYAVCTATRSILVIPAQILQVRPASIGGDGPDGLW